MRGQAAGSAYSSQLRMLLRPPARFDSLTEQRYLGATNRAARPAREASLWLILVIWLSYVGWDYFHHVHGRFAMSEVLLGARAAGTIAILGALVLIRRSRVSAVATINVTCLLIYACALLTILVVGLRNSVFYFTSLPLIMLLTFGSPRLPSRSVIAILGVEILATYLVLINGGALVTATRISTRADYVSDLKVGNAGLDSGRGGHAGLKRVVRDDPSIAKDEEEVFYFTVAAMLYLFAFALVGAAVAIERERLSRETYLREAQLSDNVAQLQASQLSAAEKTAALIQAQGALRDEAEHRNAEKTVFLRDLAHDLRNALAVVTLSVANAADAIAAGDGEGGGAALADVRAATRLARNTLDAVLEMARLESDQVNPDYAEVELASVLQAAALMCAGLAAERGVRVRLRLGRPGATIRTDPTLLSRLIGNLVVNAVKYSDPAKRGRQQVLLGAVVYPRRVRIDVVDNGLGISPSDQRRIWQPFVQLDNPHRDRERGVGLGLSIVKGIAARLEQHRLTMKSRVGKGTRFFLDVPRGEDIVPQSAPLTSAARHQRLARSYMLLVEDDPYVRKALAVQIRRLGVLCDDFGSLGDLAAALGEIERTPDLVITDFRLPEACTGADVVRLVRARFDADVPAVILTGELGPFDFGELAGSPPRVLHKPLEPERLIEELAAMLPAEE